MSSPCDTCPSSCSQIVAAEHPPYGEEFFSADGVLLKQIVIPKAGSIVAQHSHEYDHLTMLVKGEMHVFSDPAKDGCVYKAPCGIMIPHGVKHSFITLVDDTVIYCVHNVSRSGKMEVREEHVPTWAKDIGLA